ncbi:MAG: N-acetylneuraminate synthase family protein [Deltaproteobacteria bacterium]|nr:N-acetylneuraminate synthase family protein [Deltaproteobacteria bacterium]
MGRVIVLDGRRVDDSSDCYVIAEVGHNHQGDVEKAKQMFQMAKFCGADAVKLQKRHNKGLYTLEQYNKPYDNENSFGRTYGQHREALEFGRDEYKALKRFAKKIGITFFATAFDFKSADFLEDLDMPAYKIASGDLKTLPLLRHVAKFGKPMIISTGGATMDDIQRVYDALMPVNRQLCFLQCTATYPTQPEELDLKVIETMRSRFPDVVIGLSDHYNGIAMAVVAYLLGARVIEKHFTLNHSWKGTDHAFSLEPIGLQKMIRDLHRVRIALGDGTKKVHKNEAGPLVKMGKKIVAARPLKKGHVLTRRDLALKSPGDGLAPYEMERTVGKRLKKSLAADENVQLDDLDG